jgi:hypothetical protein
LAFGGVVLASDAPYRRWPHAVAEADIGCLGIKLAAKWRRATSLRRAPENISVTDLRKYVQRRHPGRLEG